MNKKELINAAKFGDYTCWICWRTFSPKKVFDSISLEEQAKTEETYISHMDHEHRKAMLGKNSLPYQRIK